MPYTNKDKHWKKKEKKIFLQWHLLVDSENGNLFTKNYHK